MRNVSRMSVSCFCVKAIAHLCGAVVLFLLSTTQVGGAEFIPLGDLAGGVFDSAGLDVSNNGIVVGESSSSQDRRTEAFFWDASNGMVGLGLLPDTSSGRSDARGISADGAVVVGTSANAEGNREAYMWSTEMGMVGLEFFDDTISEFSKGADVSGDGLIITGHGDGPNEAFRWTHATGLDRIGTLNPPAFSHAHEISFDGSTIVGIADFRPVKWTTQGIVDLSTEQFPNGEAFAVSENGELIAATVDGPDTSTHKSAIWSEAEGWRLLGDTTVDLFARQSQPDSISADGGTVLGRGFVLQDDVTRTPYIWDSKNGMRFLHDVLAVDYNLGLQIQDWTILIGFISNNGRYITGAATNPNGNTEAYLIDLQSSPIPEPSAAALFATAVACLIGFRCRRSTCAQRRFS
jgi:probable HAF family extracellular repeat protein